MITVLVGSITSSGTIINDFTHEVKFEGEQVAQQTEYGMGRSGTPTDTRGVTETLYRMKGDRLIVHVKNWSHWQGEPNNYVLQEIEEVDLKTGGRFERLGWEAGYGRPLTLDEALERYEPEHGL